MNAWHPQPIQDVVGQIEQAAKLRVLVDWRALSELGWQPDSHCTLVARAATVEEVLEKLLSPKGLEIRPVRESIVQITTAKSNGERPYLEFYTLQDLGEEGLDQLEKFERVGIGRFVLDTDSDTALVVLPPTQHRILSDR